MFIRLETKQEIKKTSDLCPIVQVSLKYYVIVWSHDIPLCCSVFGSQFDQSQNILLSEIGIVEVK